MGLPGTRLGRYDIVALIGAGGMGEVYRARDPNLGRDVAVKVLPERLGADGANGERQRRVEREARAAAELEHPNIVAVHDFGVDGGVAFIVTELLDGATLAEALRRGPLPRARAIDIGVQIARGVAAAHDKAIVHRDLKPANVFLCSDGRVKILDFGLAAHVAGGRPGGTDSTVTETGAILGTPAYMSPEQVRGQRADLRADLFAVGTILYEMVAGRRPFAGESAVELAHAIVTEEPAPLEDPALDAIVRLCIARTRRRGSAPRRTWPSCSRPCRLRDRPPHRRDRAAGSCSGSRAAWSRRPRRPRSRGTRDPHASRPRCASPQSPTSRGAAAWPGSAPKAGA